MSDLCCARKSAGEVDRAGGNRQLWGTRYEADVVHARHGIVEVFVRIWIEAALAVQLKDSVFSSCTGLSRWWGRAVFFDENTEVEDELCRIASAVFPSAAVGVDE
ncbi:hypothetical protein D3C77_533080 [compost metagenome]